MPRIPKTPCGYPGCPELVEPGTGGRCAKHKKAERRQHDRDYDKQRGTAHQRGYTANWRRYARAYLRQHPLCVCGECATLPVPRPAQVVDHITPHRGDHTLFWDPDNHQAMATVCHNKKTAKEDGGFGRATN